ncbi:MAG: hypothetical protein A3F42_01790 [Gammaproteobacteria bacterium RIFCSPHIGHO2_12_FULL_37_34]|nr:MAG: hypothetical protein A3F42_01790 [Gammaproteobacteria bacterium RIFCSPHIGHO2_12_FULL_37_34]
MNYHHTYHAGNFADVVKHIILIELLTYLKNKPTPFCYIDTHAGSAYHDLFSEFAVKNKEYLNGIEKIIQQEQPPAYIKRYLDCIHQINSQLAHTNYSSLRYYPGSSMIAHYFMRPQDRIIACEHNPPVYQSLKLAWINYKQVSIHHMDGYLALKAFTPPREQRGLVLIDPSFEHPDEFKHIALALPSVFKRWRNAMVMIWYPIKEKFQVERFHRTIRQLIKQPILVNELSIFPDLHQHLNGCGIIVINPPWKLDQSLNKIYSWLWKTLSINHQGQYRSYLLK